MMAKRQCLGMSPLTPRECQRTVSNHTIPSHPIIPCTPSGCWVTEKPYCIAVVAVCLLWLLLLPLVAVGSIKEGRPASKPSIVASAPLAKLVKVSQRTPLPPNVTGLCCCCADIVPAAAAVTLLLSLSYSSSDGTRRAESNSRVHERHHSSAWQCLPSSAPGGCLSQGKRLCFGQEVLLPRPNCCQTSLQALSSCCH